MRRSGFSGVAALVVAGVATTAALAIGTVGAQTANQPAPRQAASGASTAPEATKPPQRTSLVPLVKPLWSSLAEGERKLLEPFAEQWNTWSAAEKRVWVSLAGRFPKLAPAEQAKAKERIAEWAALSPAERKQARANYRLARQMSSEERVTQWQRYEEMTPAQQRVLRIGGWTSNTGAKHAGARTGLAKEAAKPLGEPPAYWSDTP